MAQTSSRGSRRVGDMIAGALWACVVIGFLYVLYRMYGRSHGHSHAHMTPLYTPPRPGISLAVVNGGASKLRPGKASSGVKSSVPAPPRGMRAFYPELTGVPLSLLDAEKITWPDIQLASEQHLETAVAAWLFAEPVPGLCELRWLPRDGKDKDGSWPLCSGVTVPHSSKCLAYGIDNTAARDFNAAFMTELGCSMRAFHMNEDSGGYPGGVTARRVGLGGDNRMDAVPPIATLSTMQGMENEQGRHLLALQIDCEGCEWEAFPQILRDHGPDAFKHVDMLFVEVHMGWRGYTPRNAAALFALLHNQGFRQYWRRFNPWSIAGTQTGGILSALRAMYGDKLAREYEATEENFRRVGKEFATYQEEHYEAWKKHVAPGQLFCCYQMAFVREAAITGPTNATILTAKAPPYGGSCPDAKS